MTHPKTALRIANTIAEIERASEWLDAFAATTKLPPGITAKFQVVLDEILSNIIRYGLPDTPPGAHDITLSLRLLPNRVELTVADDGLAFDPTRAAPKPATQRDTQRRIGGAGLLFVQSLMDEMHYARLDGCNRLVLCKRLPPPADPGAG